MNINDTLDALLKAALNDEKLKKTLLDTQNSADPMADFCDAAEKAGFHINIGEFFALNEIMCNNLLKSTNGGATYPIDDWGDAYEQFISSLK